jgi:hypothetical protein
VSAKVTDPSYGFRSATWDIRPVRNQNMNVSKLRVAAAGLLTAVGFSLLGTLAAPVASADPWVPGSGPLHPMRHYAADVLHPVWAIRHPIRAAMP